MKVVEKMKSPTCLKEVRAVLGLVGFYRKYVPGTGKTSEPLYNLLKKENKFVWTKECEQALQELKEKLLSAPNLGYPNNRDEYTLTTDASLTGNRAVLTQQQEGIDRVVSYASKTLNKSQKNYSATKKELFDVVHFTNHFKTYL